MKIDFTLFTDQQLDEFIADLQSIKDMISLTQSLNFDCDQLVDFNLEYEDYRAISMLSLGAWQEVHDRGLADPP